MRKLLFFLVCFIPLLSLAQVEDSLKVISNTAAKQLPKIRYKSTVVSLFYREFRDEGFSPLLYRGPSFQVAKYNERWRKKSITKFEMVIGGGEIQPNKNYVNTLSKVSSLNMEINYHYMFPVKKLFKNKGNWYLGGILTNTFDGRLYLFLPNNSFGYEFSNAINPATHFSYDFKMGQSQRKFQAGFKLNFALLAQVVRPNYIGMEPYQTYNGENIKPLAVLTHGNKIALPNHFFRINTEVYFDRFKIGNNDKIRIFYGWGVHVTKLPQSNPLYSAYHTIGVVSMLYSEKNKKVRKVKSEN
ncbi:MAG TPA: hypothetical protein VNW06_04525 [Cytophagaceae bacterium]|jgi:hypothetical protein|nr:hypothetical protein [Cytophagaceae bacterium]